MVHWYLRDMPSKAKKWVVTLICAIIVITSFLAYQLQQFIFHSSLQVSNQGHVLIVSPGMSIQNISETLAKEGVLKHPSWLVAWVRLIGANGKLQAGEYLIRSGSTPNSLIRLLISGKVIQHTFTIIEGWNFERLMAALNEEPHLTHTLKNLSKEDIMKKIGFHNEHPEGRFLPETYCFTAGTTDVVFLQRAYSQLKHKLAQAWNNRSSFCLLKTPYDALILASIIEKESGFTEEYADISGVYHRRLKLNMPLQADPTVIYGAGKAYIGKVTFSLLKQPSPYNTYLNTGLPPTPIAMPSEKALMAATNPREGDSLYFVAKGTGRGHIFSKTLDEHNVAVRQYRKVLGNQNQNKLQNQYQSLPNQNSIEKPIQNQNTTQESAHQYLLKNKKKAQTKAKAKIPIKTNQTTSTSTQRKI